MNIPELNLNQESDRLLTAKRSKANSVYYDRYNQPLTGGSYSELYFSLAANRIFSIYTTVY